MWVCFSSPSTYLLSFHLSPCKHTGHTQTWASNMVLLHGTLSLLSSLSPSHLPSLSFSFSYSPHSCLFFPLSVSILPQPFSAIPPLMPLLFRLFFLCSFLSFIPPPTLSQVKRFLPCFSSNWQMRCMSWLHCCFIRKQLFAHSLPPPLASSLFTSLPLCLSTPHSFLHISSCFSPYISQSVLLSLM